MIGSQLRAYPDLWRQAIEDGHQICNHTYSHRWLSALSSEEIKREIFRWEEVAREVLGEENGSIILLHFNARDVATLEEIIAGIKGKGLRIVTVTEVLN